jgi:hypothetical protein
LSSRLILKFLIKFLSLLNIAYIAIGMDNREAIIWNWKTQTAALTLPYNDGWGFMKFLRDGRLAAEWDVERTNIWNLTTGQVDFSFPSKGWTIEQLSNSSLLATSGYSDIICIWSLIDGQLVTTIQTPQQQYFLKQTCISNYLVSIDSDGALYMWNLTDNSQMWTRSLSNAPITMETMTNGNLVTVTFDGCVQIWNVLTGDCYNSLFVLTLIEGLTQTNSAIMTSNNTLIIGSNQMSLVLVVQINLNAQFNVKTVYSLPSTVQGLTVTTDNMLLVGSDGQIFYYNLNTSTQMSSYTISSSDSILFLPFYGLKIKC